MGLQRHDEVVLLLGAPGAGKGTQARFLAATLQVPHVASGDLLREHRQAATELGRAAQEYMERGDLVPDALVVDMIVDRLDKADAVAGALLDGFPRTIAQAEALDGRLRQRGGTIRTAIYVEVPPEVLVERLAGRWMCRRCQSTFHELFNPPAKNGACDMCEGELYQRSDDKREVVANRVAVYLRDTLPVVARYDDQKILRRVNGNRSIDEVKADLRRAVGADQAILA
ncbi:MAG TPA: adenylate kinase [Chloroflexota bacterium]|jgi:adenylate kinase|nr:adenylate kinase [Chloroflexota bacterium]